MRAFLDENGFYVLAVTALGRPLHLIRNRLLAAKLGVRTINIGPRSHLRGLSAIAMGEDFAAGEGLWLEAVLRYGEQQFTPRLSIGKHVHISHWSHIACTRSVTIGDHVLIGSKVLITDHAHGLLRGQASSPDTPPASRPLEAARSVSIGNNVWLGDGVIVCPGVTVGAGSIAGANAVITKDVAPYTIVAGAPARTISRYDAERGSWNRV